MPLTIDEEMVFDIVADMSEEVREQLEANEGISQATRDACFRPWSDPFIGYIVDAMHRDCMLMPLGLSSMLMPLGLGMALYIAIMRRFPAEDELRVKGASCIAVAQDVMSVPVYYPTLSWEVETLLVTTFLSRKEGAAAVERMHQARERQQTEAVAERVRQQKAMKAGQARERQQAEAMAERVRQQEAVKAGQARFLALPTTPFGVLPLTRPIRPL